MFLSIGKFSFRFSLQRYYFLPIQARKTNKTFPLRTTGIILTTNFTNFTNF